MEERFFGEAVHTGGWHRMRSWELCCRASPKGMRTYTGFMWASLRLATYSAYTAGHLATYPGVAPEMATKLFCYVRSQMGYIVGDTGFSYVVGYGSKYPTQVHHRDAACTMEEDAAGKCDRCDPLSSPPSLHPYTLHLCM
jgi:hypothetical protein